MPSKARPPAIAGSRPGGRTRTAAPSGSELTILEECWRPAFSRSLAPRITALERDLSEYLRYYNFDRAHTGRLTKGRVPGEIVFGAQKMGTVR